MIQVIKKSLRHIHKGEVMMETSPQRFSKLPALVE